MTTLTNKQTQAVQTYLFTWNTFEKVREMQASARVNDRAAELALDGAQEVIEAYGIENSCGAVDLVFDLLCYRENPPRTAPMVAAVVGEIADACKSGNFVDWCERHPETPTAKEWLSYCARERKAA